jgi:hypothetical protein
LPTTPNDWPFDQPPDCAVISLRSIVLDGAPILYVSHDADDHGWQFLGVGDLDVTQAAIVGLQEMVELDSTILEVADLPPGGHASRPSPSAPWTRGQK